MPRKSLKKVSKPINTTTFVPGCRVRIVGGTYKGTFGIFEKETDCRFRITVDGCPDAKYLDKNNVKVLHEPYIKEETQGSSDQSSDDNSSNSECDNNKAKLQQQFELLQQDIAEAKHLISVGLSLLAKTEIELDAILKQLKYI